MAEVRSWMKVYWLNVWTGCKDSFQYLSKDSRIFGSRNHKYIFGYVGYSDTLKGPVYLGFNKKINNDNFVEGIMLWLHSMKMRKWFRENFDDYLADSLFYERRFIEHKTLKYLIA